MNTESRIVIRAPRQTIFDTTSDLSRWPSILPHYRSIKYLERGNDRHVVKMAAHRDGIPVSWVSEQIIDRDALEIHFHHLRAFTKGMDVVWSFQETPDGTLVRIIHDLKFRVPSLAPLAERIIGDFFIENIANKTLRAFKAHFE
jgi:Predicted integral membrane protein